MPHAYLYPFQPQKCYFSSKTEFRATFFLTLSDFLLKPSGHPGRIKIAISKNLNCFHFIFSFLSFFAECQITSSGVRTFVCPQRNSDGSVECISAERLCNGDPDCPGGDDEDEKLCLFHRPVTFFIILQFFASLANKLEYFFAKRKVKFCNHVVPFC